MLGLIMRAQGVLEDRLFLRPSECVVLRGIAQILSHSSERRGDTHDAKGLGLVLRHFGRYCHVRKEFMSSVERRGP